MNSRCRKNKSLRVPKALDLRYEAARVNCLHVRIAESPSEFAVSAGRMAKRSERTPAEMKACLAMSW